MIVVNWNRKHLLRTCLDSLAKQSHPDFEVVVIDNGSQDGSAEMVHSLITTYPVPLRLIENSVNKGFCAANNQGFAATQSEFVALLNNDAEAEPGWLAAMEHAIGKTPDVGMAASKILVWEDPARIDKCGHLIYPDGQNRGRGSGQLDRGQFDQLEEALWPDGCAAMYRRAMLEDIGSFDEDFFAYADDAELGLRARIAGWRCFYVPNAVVRHHRGSTLGLGSAERLALIERNRVLLVAKLFPWSLIWVNGAYHFARIIAGIWAAARNKGEIRNYPGAAGKLIAAAGLARGLCSALPMIPRMLRKRRSLRRRLTSRQVKQLLLRYRISLKEISEQAV
ncbi:MAG: glycosyltransferase family 2 protein [Bryobacterales bacterium]|nr:glycosyltransferase family 2 protein [Bryobacterales bacterium]MBV9398746.1 glycosyltransferase family 2 protein [Bryobacterales bacterium]